MDIDALSYTIRDHEILRKGYTNHDGFVFCAVRNPANVFDAITIRNPSSACRFLDVDGVSERSLEDHIAFINSHQLTKAYIVADDISFLAKCPTLEHLTIIPSVTAGNGFDYAFRYPGMNKVLQAAGRVIRTTEDTGVILLLDERFLQADYQALYPREWNVRNICNSKNVEALVDAFWAKK